MSFSIKCKSICSFAACLLAFSMPASVYAADDELSPEQKRANYAVKTRQAVFTLMGSNMGPLGGMARGKIPFDAALAGKSATRISQLANMVTDSFKLDTSGFEVTTEALDVIWEDFESFEKKAMAAGMAADKLIAAAATGDEGASKSAIGALGKTCGSCHDAFRVE